MGTFRDGFALGFIRASAPYSTQAADVVEKYPYRPPAAILETRMSNMVGCEEGGWGYILTTSAARVKLGAEAPIEPGAKPSKNIAPDC